jgi:hypothetical protein
MFGLFQRSRPARRPLTTPRARPALQQLEQRDSPPAPLIKSMTATHNGSNLVVSGQVFDESPQTVGIALGGAVSATVTANSNGQFHYIVAWPGGTQVTGVATDNESLSSTQNTATIANPSDANPFLTLSVTYGSQRQVTLSGQVYDESPGGRTVTFTGAASGSTTTDSQGYFSVTLTASMLGSVMATTTDAAGQSSNAAQVQLQSSRPVIQGFTCSEQSDGYLFSGTVLDESPGGLVVYLGGVPVSLQGKTVTVQADGTWSILIQLNGTQTDEGTATAYVTDWWGQQSETALTDVHQTGV